MKAWMYLLTRFFTGARLRTESDAVLYGGGSQIFFANHTSHLDALVIWSVLPPEIRSRVRPVAARDYWERSGCRRYFAMKVFHAVLVDRKPCVHGQEHPLRPLFDALDTGDSLILFPEGSRSADGRIGEFKPGLYHLAERFPEVDLVPVHLENLNHVMPKGEFLPVPLICTVTMGAPLPRIREEPKTAFLERARNAVHTLGKPA